MLTWSKLNLKLAGSVVTSSLTSNTAPARACTAQCSVVQGEQAAGVRAVGARQQLVGGALWYQHHCGTAEKSARLSLAAYRAPRAAPRAPMPTDGAKMSSSATSARPGVSRAELRKPGLCEWDRAMVGHARRQNSR